MKKYAYLAKLEELLQDLPPQERDDALNYYEEYFDAAGRGNEEATAAELGDPAEAAREILAGTGMADAAPASCRPAPDDGSIPDTDEAEQPPAETPEPVAEPPKYTMPEIRPIYLILPLLAVIAVILCMMGPLITGTASTEAAASSEEEFAASVPMSDAEETEASSSGEEYLYAGRGETPRTISIEAKNADVVIEPAEGDTFSAVLRAGGNESYLQTMTYLDGVSDVYSLTGGAESEPSVSVTLYLPQSETPLDEVQILTTKGSVTVNCELNAERVVIHAGADLSTETVTAGDLELRSTWGNLTTEMLDAPGIRLRSARGSVTATLKENRDAYDIQAQSDNDKVMLDGQDYGSSITANAAASIQLNAQAAGPCSLSFGA